MSISSIIFLETWKTSILGGNPAPVDTEAKDAQNVLLVCSSDKGLCGAIHSSLGKCIRSKLDPAAVKDNASVGANLIRDPPASLRIVNIGDKVRPQLSRDARTRAAMAVSFNTCDVTFSNAIKILMTVQRRFLPTQEEQTKIASEGLPVVPKYNSISVLYNRFASMIAYEAYVDTIPVGSVLGDVNSSTQPPYREALAQYEMEEGVLEDWCEWLQASRLFWALSEGHASEMAARRMAMENASKNADSIVAELTMKYNRTRQAVITNELVDIITGASAL